MIRSLYPQMRPPPLSLKGGQACARQLEVAYQFLPRWTKVSLSSDGGEQRLSDAVGTFRPLIHTEELGSSLVHVNPFMDRLDDPASP